MVKKLSSGDVIANTASDISTVNNATVLSAIRAYREADNMTLDNVKAALSIDIKAVCLFVVRRSLVDDMDVTEAIKTIGFNAKLVHSGLPEKFSLLAKWKANGLMDSLGFFFPTTDPAGIDKGSKTIWKAVEAAYTLSKMPSGHVMVAPVVGDE